MFKFSKYCQKTYWHNQSLIYVILYIFQYGENLKGIQIRAISAENMYEFATID